MRQIKPESSRLEVFDAKNKSSTPDFIVPSDDIQAPDVPKQLGPLKEQASFTLLNTGGKYTTGAKEITSGDRVEFYTAFGPTSTVGNPEPGNETESSPIRRFTGVVRNPETEIQTNRSTFSFDAEDFVGFVMANRTIEAGFNDRQVAGTPGSILEQILDEVAPEIGHSQITPIDKTTSITFNASTLLKAVRRVVARGDVILGSDGRDLVVRPLKSTAFNWQLTPDDWGVPFKVNENDDLMVNWVRLDGGQAVADGSSQLVQSSWTNVTENSRILYMLNMPKDQIVQIELWTDPRRTDSGDGISVRLQRNQNGSPADVGNEQLDFARRTISEDFLAHDGLTTFLMPDHDIVDHTVWMIIEGDGAGNGNGQDIGTDGSGTPTYQAGYPFPISARADDQESIEEYRRRDRQIADESIHGLREAQQEVNAILSNKNVLKRTISFPAMSLRAHELEPMDGIVVDNMEAGISGGFIVTKRKDSFDGPNQRISTEIELTDIKAIGQNPPKPSLKAFPTTIASGDTVTVEQEYNETSSGGMIVNGGLTVEGGLTVNDG